MPLNITFHNYYQTKICRSPVSRCLCPQSPIEPQSQLDRPVPAIGQYISIHINTYPVPVICQYISCHLSNVSCAIHICQILITCDISELVNLKYVALFVIYDIFYMWFIKKLLLKNTHKMLFETPLLWENDILIIQF